MCAKKENPLLVAGGVWGIGWERGLFGVPDVPDFCDAGAADAVEVVAGAVLVRVLLLGKPDGLLLGFGFHLGSVDHGVVDIDGVALHGSSPSGLVGGLEVDLVLPDGVDHGGLACAVVIYGDNAIRLHLAYMRGRVGVLRVGVQEFEFVPDQFLNTSHGALDVGVRPLDLGRADANWGFADDCVGGDSHGGSPLPDDAEHVLNDLNGRPDDLLVRVGGIPVVLDGVPQFDVHVIHDGLADAGRVAGVHIGPEVDP